MRPIRLPILALLLAAGLVAQAATAARAQDLWSYGCEELWSQRNTIYKRAGYCFRTPRAIQVFGNAGCRVNSESALALSDDERALIARIDAVGRTKRCQ